MFLTQSNISKKKLKANWNWKQFFHNSTELQHNIKSLTLIHIKNKRVKTHSIMHFVCNFTGFFGENHNCIKQHICIMSLKH